MKKALLLVGMVAAVCSGCQKRNSENQVVSERYLHKYGYAVSKEEWNTHNYPGQVIVNLRDGVVLTTTYEAGMKHGPCTYTFPDSQVVSKYYLYDKGEIVKEIRYDLSGMPDYERVQLSPTRVQITSWYTDGTPCSIEEYANGELLEGQYFSRLNDVEARVEKGTGRKLSRDKEGLLLSIEEVAAGYTTKKESFFPNGTLSMVAHYNTGKLHGEKKTFNTAGEPLAVEEYVGDVLHGKSTFFRNGTKHYDISYLYGQKNGLETHYVDGEEIAYQISWESDQKHGPEVFYSQGAATTSYFYAGSKVSKGHYDELVSLDHMVSQISPEFRE